MNAVVPPIVKYYGSKARLSPWIVENILNIPHNGFVDVCGGAGNITSTYLFMKGPAKVVTYNDLDDEVVNFFRVLREHGQEFRELIRLTPYSRMEHESAYVKNVDDTDIERARKYFVRSWQSFASKPGKGLQGWRSDKNGKRGVTGVADEFYRFETIDLVAKLFQRVQIECKPFQQIIKMYGSQPDFVLYVDPPYLNNARNRREHGAYTHEFAEEDHLILANALKSAKASAIVSHKPCEMYDKLYDGWERKFKDVQNTSKKSHTEALYIKPGTFFQERLI